MELASANSALADANSGLNESGTFYGWFRNIIPKKGGRYGWNF